MDLIILAICVGEPYPDGSKFLIRQHNVEVSEKKVDGLKRRMGQEVDWKDVEL